VHTDVTISSLRKTRSFSFLPLTYYVSYI
jgi:hypothetical protein